MKIGSAKVYALKSSPYRSGIEDEADGRGPWRGQIKTEVAYSLGGANFFHGTQEKRGYWLHVTPTSVRDSMECFTIGSGPRGLKVFLLEVKRRTAKGDAEAVRLGALKEREALDRVLQQPGLELADGVVLPPLLAQAVPVLPRGVVENAPPPPPISARQTWLTKEDLARLPALGSQDGNPDPVAQVKFFDPSGSWTWYATEYDPAEGRFFGLVQGAEEELGYFTLAELQSVRGRMGLGVERDRHWTPRPLSALRKVAA